MALTVLAGAESASAAPVGTITEFSAGLPAGSFPFGIVAGPDGNLWFSDRAGAIGRITLSGRITEFTSLTPAGGTPFEIASGPDGNLWFTDPNSNAIGRITPTGTITEFTSGLNPGSQPTEIAPGPDGNLWFTDQNFPTAIERITPTGTITEFTSGPLSAYSSLPQGIAAGPDGNLWFTDRGTGAIGRITPTGTITEFSTNLPGSSPFGIAAGPDGNLWFTDPNNNAIGRITTGGQITEFTGGMNADSYPQGIAAGPDGNLWFTELDTPAIGRITTGGQITEFTSGLNAGSFPFGIAAGPDGNLWFTDLQGAIGRIVDGPPLLGNAKLERGVDYNPAGTAEAFVTRVSYSGQMSSLHLYLDSSSTASQVVVGVYSDRNGHPGSLQGQARITNVLAGNWNYVQTPTTLVTAGQRVWIAVLGPSGAGTIRFRDATSGPSSETSAQHNLTALRATWSTGHTYHDGPLSAYGN